MSEADSFFDTNVLLYLLSKDTAKADRAEVLLALSTPQQKCIGWPEQKYISDAGKKAPELGAFRQTSDLGGIIRRCVRAGTA